MIIDALLQFSSSPQAITATAASTDQIDLGPLGQSQTVRDIAVGETVYLVIRTVQAFNNLTSLTFALQTDDASNFPSAAAVWTSSAIPLASLTANRVQAIVPLPSGIPVERFLRMNYTVAGTAPTTGSVDAFIVKDMQQYRAYADAQPIASNA